MRLLILLAVASCCYGFSFLSLSENLVSNLMGFHEGDNCEFTREQSLDCLREYVDLNHNGEIEASEFDYAKTHYLPPVAQRLQWLASKANYDIPFSQLLRDCDPNHDGILSEWDWMHSTKTCLPTQSQMCKLKTICNRAKAVSQ